MKILVIGLDGAAPDLLFGDPRLTNLRRLMECGCYGPLESVIPPQAVPAWMSMATGLDPGWLGLYGLYNRAGRSYAGMTAASSRSVHPRAIWDQVAREGKRACVIAVPPGYPPRKLHGVSVGCFLTPDTRQAGFAQPAAAERQIRDLVGDYPVDVRGHPGGDPARLLREIYGITRAHFQVVRHFLQQAKWDFFQFVEIGLDRMQHAFWQYHDPGHRLHVPGNPCQNAIRDYYGCLDQEIGTLLGLLDDQTAVLVVSDHGAKRLEGGFCTNEFLIREGLLVLDVYPRQVTPFSQLAVNWAKTTAWSAGGTFAPVFLNVRLREPQGKVDPGDYHRVRDELAARLQTIRDDRGRPLRNLVFKPEETFAAVNGIAPDLLVHLGGLDWRSVGSVGHAALYVQDSGAAADGCNHAQHGAFILAAPGCPLQGQVEGTRLLDIAPTLLELSGGEPLPHAQGRSLIGRCGGAPPPCPSFAEEEILRQRLSSLGYV
jgi:predicted AlkP superfamily phosphohydrolase/phosphomutase